MLIRIPLYHTLFYNVCSKIWYVNSLETLKCVIKSKTNTVAKRNGPSYRIIVVLLVVRRVEISVIIK